MSDAAAKTARGIAAALVQTVEATWSAIRDHNPDVPPVIVTLGAGAKKQGLVLGHFAAGAWQSGDHEVSELFVGGEGLKAGAAELLVTLLHEAAHGLAHTRGIKDTSRQGRYHNDRYRTLAEEIGLTVSKDAKLGWSPSALTDNSRQQYADQVDQLAGVLVAYRRSFGRADDTGRPSSNNGVSAVCDCGRKIRVSRTVYELGPIQCTLCETPFTAPDESENEGDE